MGVEKKITLAVVSYCSNQFRHYVIIKGAAEEGIITTTITLRYIPTADYRYLYTKREIFILLPNNKAPQQPRRLVMQFV